MRQVRSSKIRQKFAFTLQLHSALLGKQNLLLLPGFALQQSYLCVLSGACASASCAVILYCHLFVSLALYFLQYDYY
jgi:hypothetical protein